MSSDPVKEKQLLDAAAEVFRSPDYDVFSDVQYIAIAERSGWGYKAVQSFFKKPELRRKLVEHMTDPAEAATRVHPELIAEVFNDRSMPFYEACLAIGTHYIDFNLTDQMIRSSMALWPYAQHAGREGGDEHIRQRLNETYKALDTQIEFAINSWLVSHSDVMRPRLDYLTVAELAQIALALTEGLSIRHSLDPEGSPADLAGRGYAAMLAAMIHFVEEEEPESPAPARIAELDRRRRPEVNQANSST